MKNDTRKVIAEGLMMLALIVAACLIAVSTAGCGHNVLAYSSGKYLNLGVDPGTNKMGIQYVNGEQVASEGNHITYHFAENEAFEIVIKY